MTGQTPHARVPKYTGRRLAQTTTYAVMYVRSKFADAPAFASIDIHPYTPTDDQRQRTRLNLVKLPEGTAISDAFTLLALAVPAPYRDLWHSIAVDDHHFAEWQGEQRA